MVPLDDASMDLPPFAQYVVVLQRFAKRLAPLKFKSSRRSIATMGEPTRSIRCRYSSKGILKRFLQSLTGSRSDATQDCLHLRKSLFNGRKIWRISWQKQQLTASSFDELPHLVSLMDAYIIHDHHLPWLQTRCQNLLDIDFKYLRIR